MRGFLFTDSFRVFLRTFLLVVVSSVVITSAVDCHERLISEVTLLFLEWAGEP